MDRIRIGVIGTGQIGKHHVEQWSKIPQAELVALADIDEPEVRRVGEKYGIKDIYTDFRQLLARPDIQAVDVCLHNNYHAPLTIEALRAGKHVYCEKPMAGSYADAAAMLAEAKKCGRMLSIQLSTLFARSTKAARMLIAEGRLGHVYHARSSGWRRRGRPFVDGYGSRFFVHKPTSAGGALFDMGVYHIAQILYLLGQRGEGIPRGEGVPPSRTEGILPSIASSFPVSSSSFSSAAEKKQRTETEEETRGQDARETQGQDARETQGQDARETQGQDALATFHLPAVERVSGRVYQETPVDAARAKESHYGVEELGMGFVRLAGGVTMDIIEAWAVHMNQFEGSAIFGSQGGVRLEPFSFHATAGDAPLDASFDLEGADVRRHKLDPAEEAYDSAQHHWVAALQGRVELLPTAEIALQTMLISQGIYLSDQLGREVTAEEIVEKSVSTALKV